MTRPSSARVWLLVAVVLAAWAGPLRAQERETSVLAEVILLTDAEQLQRGLQAFHNGEYDICLVVLGQVDPMELGRDQRIQLHEMMGKAYYFQGDLDAARTQFFEVLKLEPTYEMDPVSTPRQIIEVYEDVRLIHTKDLRMFPVEPERTIPGRSTPRVAPGNMFMVLAPAGVFRLAFLRTPRSGFALLTAQLVPLTVSTISAAYLYWANDKGNFVAVLNAFQIVRGINIVSGIVSVVVWAVGVFDAILSQEYHGQRGRQRRKVAEGWRWGPPIAAPAFAPD